jgi:hypothetical protein
MPDFWITTHWPTPQVQPGQSRHVFVSTRSQQLPAVGDIIFFREAIHARIDGKRVRFTTRCHRGERTQFPVPKGRGGIIGIATVAGPLRSQKPEDVVFEVGEPKQWLVVPCREFRSAELPLHQLLELTGTSHARFLNLWKFADAGQLHKVVKALHAANAGLKVSTDRHAPSNP